MIPTSFCRTWLKPHRQVFSCCCSKYTMRVRKPTNWVFEHVRLKLNLHICFRKCSVLVFWCGGSHDLEYRWTCAKEARFANPFTPLEAAIHVQHQSGHCEVSQCFHMNRTCYLLSYHASNQFIFKFSSMSLSKLFQLMRRANQ